MLWLNSLRGHKNQNQRTIKMNLLGRYNDEHTYDVNGNVIPLPSEYFSVDRWNRQMYASYLQVIAKDMIMSIEREENDGIKESEIINTCDTCICVGRGRYQMVCNNGESPLFNQVVFSDTEACEEYRLSSRPDDTTWERECRKY